MGSGPDPHPCWGGVDSNHIIGALGAHLDHPESWAWTEACTLSVIVLKYNTGCILFNL